jgi:outer membrane murein-binding lipoprotein Lpp
MVWRAGKPHATPMIRKIVSALVLVPLAIVLIAFAVANRQIILVSLDPFDQTNPALSIRLPLFAVILIVIIAAVIVGGIAAWLRQSKWRRAARLAQAQVRELQAQVDVLERQCNAAKPPAAPLRMGQAPRLRIPPPAA